MNVRLIKIQISSFDCHKQMCLLTWKLLVHKPMQKINTLSINWYKFRKKRNVLCYNKTQLSLCNRKWIYSRDSYTKTDHSTTSNVQINRFSESIIKICNKRQKILTFSARVDVLCSCLLSYFGQFYTTKTYETRFKQCMRRVREEQEVTYTAGFFS